MDDISLALENGVAAVEELSRHCIDDVSPALELLHCRQEVLSSLGESNGWLDPGEVDALLAASATNQSAFVAKDGRHGMISIAEIVRNPTAWTNFAITMKSAAIAAGFSPDHGGKLLAATTEFYQNAIEHSDSVETGQIIFAARARRFEFVVRDRGVGVLKSLKKNPEYAHLKDGGSAIELALKEGVSSKINDLGRGLGFRPVFVGLANLSEYIRFRSGGHCREYVRQPNGSIDAHTKQTSRSEGFTCSVICTPTST